MKHLKKFLAGFGPGFGLLAFSLLVFSLVAFGDVTEPLPDASIQAVLDFLRKLPGATGAGIAAAVTQLLLVFFRTSLANFAGVWKLVIVTLLAWAGAGFDALAEGSPLIPALFTGTGLAAFQVFFNQLIKQIGKAAGGEGEGDLIPTSNRVSGYIDDPGYRPRGPRV